MGNALSYVVFGKRYNRLASARSFDETGVASWYGRKFHGRLTASGEPYDMYSMTAAHKSIPLPTYARVTNLANDRSVVVRINDRGPFVGSRLIDLSYAAAAKLDMLAAGTANVRVVALSGVPGEDNQQTQASVQIAAVEPSIPSFKKPYEEPRPVLSGPVSLPVSSPGEESGASGELLLLASPASQFLQIGAYGSFMAADELRTRMEGSVRGEVFVSKLPSGSLFRVRIGPFSSGAELAAARDILRDRHSINAIVVAPAEARSTCC